MGKSLLTNTREKSMFQEKLGDYSPILGSLVKEREEEEHVLAAEKSKLL